MVFILKNCEFSAILCIAVKSDKRVSPSLFFFSSNPLYYIEKPKYIAWKRERGRSLTSRSEILSEGPTSIFPTGARLREATPFNFSRAINCFSPQSSVVSQFSDEGGHLNRKRLSNVTFENWNFRNYPACPRRGTREGQVRESKKWI